MLKFILELRKTLRNGFPFLNLFPLQGLQCRNGTVNIIDGSSLESDQ